MARRKSTPSASTVLETLRQAGITKQDLDDALRRVSLSHGREGAIADIKSRRESAARHIQQSLAGITALRDELGRWRDVENARAATVDEAVELLRDAYEALQRVTGILEY